MISGTLFKITPNVPHGVWNHQVIGCWINSTLRMTTKIGNISVTCRFLSSRDRQIPLAGSNDAENVFNLMMSSILGKWCDITKYRSSPSVFGILLPVCIMLRVFEISLASSDNPYKNKSMFRNFVSFIRQSIFVSFIRQSDGIYSWMWYTVKFLI